jgi:hypothetical protein
MPWTFAHPAAVLPLRTFFGRRLHLSALIVGSITPDIAYYFGQFLLATHAHSLGGLLFICLPLGIVSLLLMKFLRNPVTFLLPQPHRTAIER